MPLGPRQVQKKKKKKVHCSEHNWIGRDGGDHGEHVSAKKAAVFQFQHVVAERKCEPMLPDL